MLCERTIEIQKFKICKKLASEHIYTTSFLIARFLADFEIFDHYGTMM